MVEKKVHVTSDVFVVYLSVGDHAHSPSGHDLMPDGLLVGPWLQDVNGVDML